MKSNNRYLGAAMIAPFIIFVFLGGVYLKAFTFLLSALALYEFYNAIGKKGYKPMDFGGYILLLAYYLFNSNIEKFTYILILACAILLIVPVINLKYTFVDVALTILGFVYGGLMFSFVYLVSEKSGGAFLVWLIFIGSWVCDTAAFYSGKFFGKHKLCPKVSPKKTIEGSIGGMLGAMIASGVFGAVANRYENIMPLVHFFVLGAICGIVGQFGDLVASSIKRYVDIKDYSNLIPGHGGILDRFDSIIFCAVTVFYYITFIVGI